MLGFLSPISEISPDLRSASPRCAPDLRSRLPSAPRARLPEIVVDALTRVEAAEGHLELVADRDRRRLDVGQLAGEAPAALEVDDRRDDRRLQRVGEVVEREGGDLATAVGEALGRHLVDRAAVDAD